MKFLNRHRSFVVLAWFWGFIGFLFLTTSADMREKVLWAMGEMLPPLMVFAFFLVGTAVVITWASHEPNSEDDKSSESEVS